MRVLIWGLGYVGTVSAACFAQMGNEVIGIETNPAKVQAVNEQRSTIKEPELQGIVQAMVAQGCLRATQFGCGLVKQADVSLICVGTPNLADGSYRLEHVKDVCVEIGKGLSSAGNYHVVAVRSTVFPGTTRNLIKAILEEQSGKVAGQDFGLVMNPEFLREGSAVADFRSPPYTIIGQFDLDSGDVIEQMYSPINAPIYRIELEEAEILKMVNNSFHALKIGFANEVGRMCDRLGIDGPAVMKLVCADHKLNISEAYLRPGFAFGGSCLPKDLRSFSYHARRLGVEIPILNAVLPSNQVQIEEALVKIERVGASRVSVLGLSFKPGTDDLRESPVIPLIQSLWQEGIDVRVFDPDVQVAEMLGSNREYLERHLPQVHQILCRTLAETLAGSQVVVVTQKRPEFFQVLQHLEGQMVVIDLVGIQEMLVGTEERNDRGLSWVKRLETAG